GRTPRHTLTLPVTHCQRSIRPCEYVSSSRCALSYTADVSFSRWLLRGQLQK
ncbi:hypothetical protein KUCAC02_012809, partial [Chaenocephalus aceratus]